MLHTNKYACCLSMGQLLQELLLLMQHVTLSIWLSWGQNTLCIAGVHADVWLIADWPAFAVHIKTREASMWPTAADTDIGNTNEEQLTLS